MSEPKSIGTLEEKPAAKKCTKCGREKPASLFRRSSTLKDGLTSRCIECIREDGREQRQNNLEKARGWQRRWRQNSGDDPHLRQRKNASNRKWSARNKHKRRAHKIVELAIIRGDLARPETCQQCGAAGNIQASHTDYSRPLDVEWLCQFCHFQKDAALRKSAISKSLKEEERE